MSSERSGDDGLPHIPVSWGELVDKVTILEIKVRRLASEAARANVRKELDLLATILADDIVEKVRVLKEKLTAVNERLWTIEDDIRVKESRGEFDAEFIALARAVYIENDERAAIKRAINVLLSSQLTEEKSYAPYRQGNG